MEKTEKMEEIEKMGELEETGEMEETKKTEEMITMQEIVKGVSFSSREKKGDLLFLKGGEAKQCACTRRTAHVLNDATMHVM